jgi:hypothetical protein
MAKEKISVPTIQLVDFINNLPETKIGKVEFVGAFDYWMEHIVKCTQGTQEEFENYLEKFKKGV